MLTYKKQLFTLLAVSLVLILGVSTLSATDVSDDTSTISTTDANDITSITEQATNNITKEVKENNDLNTKESSTSKTLKSDDAYNGVIYVSTNGSDDNDGSIDLPKQTVASAIDASIVDGASHQIIIKAGTYNVVNKTITADLQITGEGNVILTANNQGRIFEVTGGKLTLNGITFTNGNAKFGGAINATTAMEITNCVFENNNATSGAAIKTIGNLTITDCKFNNNTVTVSGSAVYVEKSIKAIISNSQFTNNTAGSYGTIYSVTNLTVDGCIFDSNKANVGADIYASRASNITNSNFTNTKVDNQGAIYLHRPYVYNVNNINIDNTTVATGVIYINAVTRLNMANVTISNSKASYMSIIGNLNGKTLIFNNVTIENSTADRLINSASSTGLLNITNSKLVNNTGETILDSQGTTNVIKTQFINNTATGNSEFFTATSGVLRSIENTFTGNKLPSTISSEIATSYVIQSPNTITATVTTKDIYNTTVNTGVVTLFEDDVEVAQANVEEGVATLTYTPQNGGTKTLVLKYSDETQSFKENTTSAVTVEVAQGESTITTNIVNSTYGNVAINVTLNSKETNTGISKADITVTLPDTTTVTAVTGDDGSIVIPLNIPVGENKVTVSFAGNDGFTASSDEVTINVNKRDSTTTATVTNNTAGNVIVTVSVTDSETGAAIDSGNIVIKSNDETVATGVISNGEAVITTNIAKVGNYTLNVQFEENSNYLGSNVDVDVSVIGRNTTIALTTIDNTYGNTKINAILIDLETGNAISDANIIVTTDNANTTGKTGADGSVEIALDIPVGENKITVTYPGDETYATTSDSLTINVAKRSSTTIATVTNNTVGNVIVDVIVSDAETGDAVDGGDVVITVNDETVGTGVISNGKAVITTSIAKIGEYTLNVAYNGNTNYLESNVNLENVAVNGIDTQIDVVIVSNSVGNTKINVTLTDKATGAAITDANVVVTLPSDDKVVGITGEDGSVVISLDLPVGDNTISVSYEGSEKYLETSTSLNVKVEEKTTTITVDPLSGVVGEKITLTANIVCSSDELVNGGRVVFKVNGKTLRDADGNIIYASVSDSKAVIEDFTIPTSWTNTNYTISAVYSGTSEFSSSRSGNETLTLTKRSATLALDDVTAKSGEVVTLSVKVTDDTTGEAVTSGKVVFKLNGKTLKDADGNNIYAVVENGVATIEYTLPSMSAKEYKLTAVFANSIYGRADANSTLTVTK